MMRKVTWLYAFSLRTQHGVLNASISYQGGKSLTCKGIDEGSFSMVHPGKGSLLFSLGSVKDIICGKEISVISVPVSGLCLFLKPLGF